MSEGNGEPYVVRATEMARQYAEELLTENKRLRGRLVEVEGQLLSSEDRVRVLELDLSAHREREKLLQQALGESERDSERFVQQYLEVERQTSNLANLYVASHRLHGSVELAQVLTSIREIVANLIGSEEMAVFEVDGRSGELVLLDSVGVDEAKLQRIEMGQGPIGTAASTAKTFVAHDCGSDEDSEPAPLSACVPLLLDGALSGAIAIFGLLPQKSELDEFDRELLDLLANRAATAIYCARLHARAEAARDQHPATEQLEARR